MHKRRPAEANQLQEVLFAPLSYVINIRSHKRSKISGLLKKNHEKELLTTLLSRTAQSLSQASFRVVFYTSRCKTKLTVQLRGVCVNPVKNVRTSKSDN